MILFPGATISGLHTHSAVGPLPEIALRPSNKSLEPTVITFLLLPGAVILPGLGPWFPAAVTTTTPSSHSCSTLSRSLAWFLFELQVVPTEILPPDPVLLPVFPNPPKSPKHVILTARSITVKHLQDNDSQPGAAPLYFSMEAVPSPAQPGYMGAMSIIVIRPPFLKPEIIKAQILPVKIYMLINPGIRIHTPIPFSGIKGFSIIFPDKKIHNKLCFHFQSALKL